MKTCARASAQAEARAVVLVAAHTPAVHSSVVACLTEVGVQYTEVRDGAAAIRAAWARYYEVVLAEVELPQVSGVEVLEWLRIPERAGSAVLVSRAGQPEVAPQAGCLGATACLEQPLASGELLAALDRALGGSRSGGPSDRIVAALERSFWRIGGRHELARMLGCSVRTVSRHVKAHTGQTVPQRLRSLRVSSARWALSRTELTVKEIAADVGLGSAAALDRLFKAATGMTPTQYREHCRRGGVRMARKRKQWQKSAKDFPCEGVTWLGTMKTRRAVLLRRRWSLGAGRDRIGRSAPIPLGAAKTGFPSLLRPLPGWPRSVWA